MGCRPYPEGQDVKKTEENSVLLRSIATESNADGSKQ
jgi:hypothetical protein